MPAPATSQPSARIVPKGAPQKPRATAPPKKRRAIRRRGRGCGDADSDDEIEREAATDSESDEQASDSDSATDDSDTEPASDDVLHDRAHLPTPRNSKSPESVVKEEARPGGISSFFAPGGDWADMVTDDKFDGPADLPVIEFTDFGKQRAPPPRKHKKTNKSNRATEPRATPAQPEEAAQPLGSFEPQPRAPSQSARQAYQHKLETDPSIPQFEWLVARSW
ncbi:hypothetical protein NLJ89_g4017 [Agrocybe chaxingu]|uniref:Uncharacterized protein n=1 Tax=Agrocybe chaxingu TaxID=84603 RepID=A0A9W8K1B7_9AGAR|nr:hypothetical protein NLJ89_g4017 [Agrocybe chaxingu]